MPDELPEITQAFEADATRWLGPMEAMIAAAEAFAEAVDKDIGKIAELQAALGTLPDSRTIRINVETTGVPGSVFGGAGGVAAAGAAAAQRDLAEAEREAAAAAEAEAAGFAMAAGDGRDLSAAMVETIAATGAATGAQERLFAVSQEGIATTIALTAATKDNAEAAAQAALSAEALKAAQDNYSAGSAAALAGELAAARATVALSRGYKEVESGAKLAADAETLLAGNAGEAGNAFLKTGAAATVAGAALAGVAWHLTWRQLHLIADALVEVAAVTVPAAAAVAAFAAGASPALEDIYTHLNAVRTTAEATDHAVYPLTGNIERLGHALAPGVLQLYGAGLEVVNARTGMFNQLATDATHVIDEFAAKAAVDMTDSGSVIGQFAAAAGRDLSQILQLFGNLLGTFGNLAKAAMESHIAEDLLGIAVAASHVVDWVSRIVPTPILAFGLALHGAWLWGGQLLGIITKIPGVKLVTWAVESGAAFAALAAEEGILAATTGVLASAWAALDAVSPAMWIGAAVAAMAAVSVWAATSKTATQQWVGAMTQAAAQARGLAQIGQTYQDLRQVTAAYAVSQQQVSQAMAGTSNHISGVAERLQGPYTEAVTAAANRSNDLAAGTARLGGMFTTEISNVKFLAGLFGTSYVQAAQLAGIANANLAGKMQGTSRAARDNLQLVKDLVAGYGGMGAVAGTLGADVNAVTFATELQNSKVGQLNQAWDTFLQTVQAPSAGILAFAQSLDQFSHDAAQTGARMSGLGGATVKASHDISSASIQLQQDFSASATAANGFLDALRLAATVTGDGGPLVQGIKDAVQVLIPLAGHSKAAQAQIYALAQEAAGPASGGMRAVAQWAGTTRHPLQQMADLAGSAALAMANLGKDAQNLAAAISSSLNQMLVQQAENLTGVSKKTAIYLSDLQHLGAQSPVTQAALAALNDATSQAASLSAQAASGVSALTGKVGNEGATAGAQAANRAALNRDIQFILGHAPGAAGGISSIASTVARYGAEAAAWGGARQHLIADLEHAGLSAQRATGKVDGLIAALNAIPRHVGVDVSYNIAEHFTGPSGLPPGTVARAGGMARGGRIPGYGGGDRHLALLEGGEAVVPKELTHEMAGWARARGIPGFQAGGVSGAADFIGGAPLSTSILEQMLQVLRGILAAVQQTGTAGGGAAGGGAGGAGGAAAAAGYGPPASWFVAKENLLGSIDALRGERRELLGRMEHERVLMRAAETSRARVEHELSQAMHRHAGPGTIHRLRRELGHIEAREMREREAYAKDAARERLDARLYAQDVYRYTHTYAGVLPEQYSFAGKGGYNGPGKLTLEIDGRQVAEVLLDHLVGAAARYGIRNSGNVTGLLRPS